MIDRLVCADGGNPDPTSTHGKNDDRSQGAGVRKAGPIRGTWPAGISASSCMATASGAETLRRSLSDWLTDMALIAAGGTAQADGYIGYMEPYATSHQALDDDREFQEEDDQRRPRARQCGGAGARGEIRKSERRGYADPNPK